MSEKSDQVEHPEDGAARVLHREIPAWLEALRSPDSSDLPSHPSLLFFRHAGRELAFSATDVGSVESIGHTHRVPHRQSPVFKGLAATGGDLVPLCDLAAVIELPTDHQEMDRVPRLIVLETPGSSGDRWSFIVDIVHGVEMSDPGSWITQSSPGSFVKALVDSPRGEVGLLDASDVMDKLSEVIQ